MPLPASLLALGALLLLGAFPVRAQALAFGSADDLLERPIPASFAVVPMQEVVVRAGPSYIFDRWRLYGSIDARAQLGPFGLGLHVPGRTGFTSTYEEDYDEGYDLLRRLAYARLNPTPRLPLYARVGPIHDLRLGVGHLVDGFQTTTVWEERTVGLEAAARLGPLALMGFADDVRLDGLVGGAVSVEPWATRPGARWAQLRLTLEGVYDLALDGASEETQDREPGGAGVAGSAHDDLPLSLGAALHVPLWPGNALVVGPYLSAAHRWDAGSSVGGGLEATAERFADLLDLRLRLGLFAYEAGFQVGRYDAFYPATRGPRRVIRSGPYFDAPASPTLPASLPPDSVEAGVDVLLDLAVRVGDAFTLSQVIRLPTDGQPIGTYRLRVAYRSSLGTRVHVALHRGVLTGPGNLFRGLDNDVTALVFDVDYPVGERLLVSMRSRYGFQRLPDAAPYPAYLVERRFEPTVGLRFRF